MKIAIGADHRGYRAKEFLKKHLEAQGVEVVDCGAENDTRSDHPVFAYRVARQIKDGGADRGILVCGTGAGMEIAANKIPGIRAVLAFNREIARLGRSHNDANVMTLAGDHCPLDDMWEMVQIFLATEFLGGRYRNRVDMYQELEEKGRLNNLPGEPEAKEPCTS